MSNEHAAQRKHLIARIINHAKKYLDAKQLKLINTFIPQYFSNVPLEDLEPRSTDELYGAVVSHWNLIFKRKPDETKVKVFNPSMERDGWLSPHTIIEVVQIDMPFLVDSMRMELGRMGYSTNLVIHLGGMQVRRNKKHEVTEVFPFETRTEGVLIEAPIYLEINKTTDLQNLKQIEENLWRVLQDVSLAVVDWRSQQERIADSITALNFPSNTLDPADIAEAKSFLHWLANDNFTFLGYRYYELVEKGKQKILKLIPNSGLGVLRDIEGSKTMRLLSDLPEEARRRALSKDIIIISKTNTKSTVHRPVFTDYIIVKRFDKKGEIVGVDTFIGLFSSGAYNDTPQDIPYIRRKIDFILEKTGVKHHGHAAKALLNILETYPRDDLFQGSIEDLSENALGIWHLQERRLIRLFIHKDPYGRYVSCLVYIPRDKFNTNLLNKIQQELVQAVRGTEVTYTTYFPESVLARIHYVIRVLPKEPITIDVKAIEKKLVEIGRSWSDVLRYELVQAYGHEQGSKLGDKYQKAFHAGYRETFNFKNAIYDIAKIESLKVKTDLGMSFYRDLKDEQTVLRFKLYRIHDTIPLSDVLPILENLGLRVIREQPYRIDLTNDWVWINDFQLEFAQEQAINIDLIKDTFQQAFHKIWLGQTGNDSFNKLVLGANMTWREVSVLRTYAKYLSQTHFPFSQAYIEEAMANNASLARLLFDLFNARFNPELSKIQHEHEQERIKNEIKTQLDQVASLDEDRIIRRYMSVILATLRTNFYQRDIDGNIKPYLSIKLNPHKVPELPQPLSMFETFIYSPRFEGIHLRSSKVARGGIRWSDRREDYRTEILDLTKTQLVKNAVIVPSGAKGGFVCKKLPVDGSREETLQEAVACYKNFIRGLLDVVDNYDGKKVVTRANTVCYDDDDPYLVVAADKGTATFSDIANEISKEYQFWLGDAFASGGSAGYDHKKMGITTRGAWESVKSHFQNMGINPHKQDFTVVGIGDMSGDVFGNGMIMSPHIKLVAAFNHLHIFIDPNPDPKTSYKERLRLYNTPRSSWSDYRHDLISKGGGVFERSAKAIHVSPAVKKLLHLTKDIVVPNELISAILKADVDLLWNGGIGTYVKASNETNDQVGDRANDALRVNGNQLQCKIVGEGGNLGFTQLARIEYELHGGRINTDFIDNSAGVDCSDREVNIKILLGDVMAKQQLSLAQRNKLLMSMTDDVAHLVLRNNYRTARSISFAKNTSMAYIELYRHFMDGMERQGKLPRALEALPDEELLQQRIIDGKGLTRPEIAVLMAYSKIILNTQILESDLPEDKLLVEYVEAAFPKRLRKQYRKYFDEHRLRREIIATQLSNEIVTVMGTTFVYRMCDETGESAADVIRAYVVSRHIFKLTEYLDAVDALDYVVDTDVQYELTNEATRLIRRATRWFLRNRRGKMDISANIDYFASSFGKFEMSLANLLVGDELSYFEARSQALIEQKVPKAIAVKFALVRSIYSGLNVIEAAHSVQSTVLPVSKVYFALMDSLDLIWFREQLNAYPINNHWAILARAAFKGDLDSLQRSLAVTVLSMPTKAKSVDARMEEWLGRHAEVVTRWRAILSELRTTTTKEFSMLAVAMRELTEVAEQSAVYYSLKEA